MQYSIDVKDRQLFSSKLKETREKRGYTQGELADSSGVSLPFYKKIESGKATPSIFITTLLAKELEIPVDYLVNHIETSKERVNRLWQENEASLQIAGKEKNLDWKAKRKILQDLNLYY